MAKSHPYASLKFEKFNWEGGWSSYARLGKNRLENGEFVILQWPDGTFEKVCVDLRHTCTIVSDMGNPAEEHSYAAWTSINHNGSPIDVLLTSIKGLKGSSLKKKD